MAKEIVSQKNLSGGINSFANPRNIEDNQFVEGDNLDTGTLGTLGIVGGFDQLWDVSPGAAIRDNPVNHGGYGLGTYNIDRSLGSPSTSGQYSVIASYKPAGAASLVSLLQADGQTLTHHTDKMDLSTNGCRADSGDSGAGRGGDDSRISYLVIDGQLVVYGDAPNGLSDNTNCFDPQIIKYVEPGQKFFVNSGSLDAVTTTAAYEQKKFFVEPPAGGNVKASTSSDAKAVWATINVNYLLQNHKIGLICYQHNQTSRDHIGWGKETDEGQSYNFFASYVYDGVNESQAVSIGTETLGGMKDDGSKFNDVTFYAVVRARSTSTDGVYQWDNQVTAVRIYYAKADKDQDIKYYIGEFPIRSFSATEYVCEHISDSSNPGYAILYGDKTGKGHADWTGKGIYHYEPPRVLTHAVNSGIRGDSKTTKCRFKTGVVLNRKLYVGGIYQTTKESPSTPKHYPDRLLKSISNKFGVLPDTEFVDVAIRDGEDIIRLAGIGNMLMQFKQNTLYVISVAGGEEYLSATYKNMGVRHPSAVTQFEGGVFWVNEFGAYVFSGSEAPINLIEGKLNLNEWKDFITDNTISGYDPINKKFFVCKDSTNILDDSGTNNPEPAEFYVFNMLTGSWNKHLKTIGEGYYTGGVYTETDQARKGISNFITYSKADGEKFMAVHLGYGDASNKGLLQYYNNNKSAMYPFKFLTKEFTSGNAHQRKSIYAVYITYRGTMTGDNVVDPGGGSTYIVPKVSLICQNAGNTITNTVLEPKSAGLGFTHAAPSGNDGWETAHYVVPKANKSATRNAYGIQLLIEPGTGSEAINNDFEISDVSFIIRLKSVK